MLCYNIYTSAFSCAGDYQSDNHLKIPPYIGKSVKKRQYRKTYSKKYLQTRQANAAPAVGVEDEIVWQNGYGI